MWCSDRSVASLYPMLFQLVVSKETMVLDYIEMRNGGIQWIPMFVRCTHDWELEILLIFFPKSLFIPAPNRNGYTTCILLRFFFCTFVSLLPLYKKGRRGGEREKFHLRGLQHINIDIYIHQLPTKYLSFFQALNELYFIMFSKGILVSLLKTKPQIQI